MLVNKLLNINTGAPSLVNWLPWDTSSDSSTINSGYTATDAINMVSLTATRAVAIWHSGSGIVMRTVDMSGSTPSYGNVTTLNLNSNTLLALASASLDNTRIFIAWSDGFDATLYGAVLTVDIGGSSIAIGSSIPLAAVGTAAGATLVDVNTACVTYKDINGNCKAAIVTFNNNTVNTPGTAFEWYTGSPNESTVVTTLTPSTIIAACAIGTSMIGRLLNISGSTITAGSAVTTLSGSNTTGGSDYIGIAGIGSNLAVAGYSVGNNKVYTTVIAVGASSLTPSTAQLNLNDVATAGKIQIAKSGNSVVKLNYQQALLTCHALSSDYGIIVDTASGDASVYNTRAFLADTSNSSQVVPCRINDHIVIVSMTANPLASIALIN